MPKMAEVYTLRTECLRVNTQALSIFANGSMFPEASTIAMQTGVSDVALAWSIMAFIAAWTCS